MMMTSAGGWRATRDAPFPGRCCCWRCWTAGSWTAHRPSHPRTEADTWWRLGAGADAHSTLPSGRIHTSQLDAGAAPCGM
eukprot:scaffold7242_cov400-Prasinococcus_capsulatus_cf.AAC.27